jgi:hypothetical protein
MGSIYHELLGNFTQIPNLIISDTKIKHTAFRLYCYYASKPSGWKIRNTDIEDKLGISKDTIASANKNLIDLGWMIRFKDKNTNGTFSGGYSYQIFAVPTEIGKNPNSVKPENGKMPTLNNTKINTPTLSDIDYFKMMYEVEEKKKKEKQSSNEYITSSDGKKIKKQWGYTPKAKNKSENEEIAF